MVIHTGSSIAKSLSFSVTFSISILYKFSSFNKVIALNIKAKLHKHSLNYCLLNESLFMGAGSLSGRQF